MFDQCTRPNQCPECLLTSSALRNRGTKLLSYPARILKSSSSKASRSRPRNIISYPRNSQLCLPNWGGLVLSMWKRLKWLWINKANDNTACHSVTYPEIQSSSDSMQTPRLLLSAGQNPEKAFLASDRLWWESRPYHTSQGDAQLPIIISEVGNWNCNLKFQSNQDQENEPTFILLMPRPPQSDEGAVSMLGSMTIWTSRNCTNRKNAVWISNAVVRMNSFWRESKAILKN